MNKNDPIEPERPAVSGAVTGYLDHVAYCKSCKISGVRGRETIRHCATGELLEVAAVLSSIGGKRPNAEVSQP